MRLERLWIGAFKNLRNLNVDFGNCPSPTVVVGRNGCGKSNLLEALTLVFRDLDLGQEPAFSYRLDYVCRGRRVHIDAEPGRRGTPLQFVVDGASLARHYRPDQTRECRPSHVFGYYSGPSNRMEAHFDKHQERFYRDLLHGVERPLRPLFYARLVHSQFVLLSFFTEENAMISRFLDQHLRIEDFDSVLFVLRKPRWKSRAGDPRFWNARGVVRDFLDRLFALSLAPLHLDRRVNTGLGESVLEHIHLYLPDVEGLKRLADGYASQREFFKALESTYISDLVSEVRIRVKARHVDGSLTFRELSEGEQQLLMVLGLLRFTKEDESLFLLDEPDTHLNPAWSMQYLRFISEVVGEQPTSHVVMATHDPLVIAGLQRGQVQVLCRDVDTGTITCGHPEEDPRGMGVAALLTSDVYGLRSQLDQFTLERLDRQRQLAIKKSRTPDEERELAELAAELADLDMTKAVRDPLYRRFVDAVTEAERAEGIQGPVLTREQQERQKALALQIVQSLRSEEEQEQ